MTVVCGVVETTHNYVEHPQVIAELRSAIHAAARMNVTCVTPLGDGTVSTL